MADIADLIAQIRTYDLERDPGFDLASLVQVNKHYNGIGPGWLPALVRNWLTEHYGYYAAATVIHDWEYWFSEDRGVVAFTASNERLRRNCKRLLQMKGCPWWKAWLYRRRVDMLADACQQLGWSAWSSTT